MIIFGGRLPAWTQTNDCASAPLVLIVTTNPCGANWIDVKLAPATVSAETPIPTCGEWPGREDIWFRVEVSLSITSMGFGAGMASSGTVKTGLAVYRGAGCGSLTQLMCKETCTGLFCIGVTGFAAQTVSGLIPGEILYI